MPFAQLRRHAFAVLLTFLASVGAMVLAPVVHPTSVELLCSATGHKLVVLTGHRDVESVTDPATSDSHGDPAGHCPLCMPAGLPPTFVAAAVEPVQPLAHVLRAIPAARLASLVGAPLPARGPPLSS